MKDDWILDVLADLQRFAELNDLPELALRLDDTRIGAALELASKGRSDSGGIRHLSHAEGRLSRPA